jgi:hypothetical protein
MLNFDLAWKDQLYSNKKSFFWSIPMIILGIFLVYKEIYAGFFLLVFGAHYFINAYNYYNQYKKANLVFLDYISSIKDDLKGEPNKNSIWEFHDEYFIYKDCRFETKIKWKMFKGYRFVEGNLFLDLSEGYLFSYILNEKEVEKEVFEKIKEFVKSKISIHTPSK